MKILLTHSFFFEELQEANQNFPPPPPLALLSMAALLKENGFKNKVYDSTFKNFNSFSNYLLRHKPTFLIIYTWKSTDHPFFRELKELRKKPSLKHTYIILTGPGAASASDIFILNGIDMVIYGEEEETLLELIDNIDKTHSPFLDHVKGLVFRNAKGGITRTAPRPVLINEDESPFPDKKAIPFTGYFTESEKWLKKVVLPARACLHEEKYYLMDGYHLHRYSPEKLVGEVRKTFKKLKPEAIIFLDADFPEDYFWLKSFAAEMAGEKSPLPYQCFAAPENLTEEKLSILFESGCEKVHFVVFNPLEEIPLIRQILKSSAKKKTPGFFIHIALNQGSGMPETIDQIKYLLLENRRLLYRLFTAESPGMSGPFPVIFKQLHGKAPVPKKICREIRSYLEKEREFIRNAGNSQGFLTKIISKFSIYRARKRIRTILQ